jgi:nitroimidazol reductase NimA-like FMN-containing flavoprotein (pyridoxamine 5'-phosphate oxidase superfamily)
VLIQELTSQASLDLLARMRFGRLACARSTQPYVVPVYFVYNNNYLYSFSTVGQRSSGCASIRWSASKWMRW